MGADGVCFLSTLLAMGVLAAMICNFLHPMPLLSMKSGHIKLTM